MTRDVLLAGDRNADLLSRLRRPCARRPGKGGRVIVLSLAET